MLVIKKQIISIGNSGDEIVVAEYFKGEYFQDINIPHPSMLECIRSYFEMTKSDYERIVKIKNLNK